MQWKDLQQGPYTPWTPEQRAQFEAVLEKLAQQRRADLERDHRVRRDYVPEKYWPLLPPLKPLSVEPGGGGQHNE